VNSTKKVLIVDSDLDAAGRLASFLFGKGYGVVQASDGQSGLTLFRTEHPDCVITETILPLLHGFELCGRIRKDPAAVPVVILSEACEDESFRAEAKRVFGAAAYLAKPFDGEAIVSTLKRLLKPSQVPAGDAELESILGALSPGSDKAASASPPPEVPPPGPAAEPAKPKPRPAKSKTRVLDVDALLDEALAEFGLQASPSMTDAAPGPDRVPAPPDQTSLSLDMSTAALDDLLGQGRGGPEAPEPFVETPPPSSLFAPKPERPKVVSGPFDSLGTEPGKKKSWLGRILAAAGLLFVVSALVYIFAAKKAPSPTIPPPSNLSSEFRSNEAGLLDASLSSTEGEAAPRLETLGIAGQKADEKKEGPPDRAGVDAEALSEITADPIVPGLIAPASVTIPVAKPPEELPVETKAPEIKTEPPPPAAKKAARGDLIDLATADVPPRLLSAVDPIYPPRARERRLEGQVSFLALISEEGSVLQVRVAKGPGGGFGFEAAAEKALLMRKYRPAEKDGVPVRVWFPITIVFRLTRSGS
jgi:TonB family protein